MSDLIKAVETALDAWERSRQWPFPNRPDREFNLLRVALIAVLSRPKPKPLTEGEIETAYKEIWRNLPSDFNHTSYGWIEQGIRYAEQTHGIE